MTEKKSESTNQDVTSAVATRSPLSRRELFQSASYSAALMLLAAAQEQAAAAPPRKVVPQTGPRDHRSRKLLQTTTDTARQQFPYFADGPWDQPEYYETIQAGRRIFPKTYQSADTDGDGRDEMIARGPGGIHVNQYDPATGQWVPMADGPPWADKPNGTNNTFWYLPQYATTIQCADIDGDGQAELIGRSSAGIEIYKYDTSSQQWNPFPAPSDPYYGGFKLWSDFIYFDQPMFFSTIQCAGIDGDGTLELIGRGSNGIEVYKYDTSVQPARWITLLAPQFPTSGGLWRDDYGWNQPQYYLTIQCADIDGDGQAELIGRGGEGLEVYKYDPTVTEPFKSWKSVLPIMSAWSDDMGWNQPQYATTIQCADIDGDGQAELIGRGSGGIEIYHFDKTSLQWTALPPPQDPVPPGNLWRDDYGWSQVQYYQTIQCADIDGDGIAELIGRGGIGLEAYKYNKSSQTWLNPVPISNVWTDANGWNQVQFYSTIQSARVLKEGDPGYIGDSTHTQAVMMGRGSLSMQTYRLVSLQEGWVQTSAPLPTFTAEEQKAYAALDLVLRGSNPPYGIGNIRSTYSDQTFHDNNIFSGWRSQMYSDANPPTSYDQSPRPFLNPNFQPPAGQSIDPFAWANVCWQIYWELRWVDSIYTWYSKDEAGGLILDKTIADFGVLSQVEGYMSTSDDTQILFTVLSLVASAAAAMLSGGGTLLAQGALGFAGAVAGGFAAAFKAVPSLLPGDPKQIVYNQLATEIVTDFVTATQGHSKNLLNLTGGTDRDTGNYVTPDFGRLKLIGPWIEDGTWQWSTGSEGGTTDFLVASSRGYGNYAWQALMQAQPWTVWSDLFNGPPSDFPSAYVFENSWLSESYYFGSEYPPTASLDNLFKPITDGFFPLGAPLADVYLGRHGWPELYQSSPASSPGPLPPPAPRLSPGVDLRLTAELSRDAITGEVVAAMTLRNRGATTATNLEITSATLHLRQAVNHAHRQMRLHQNHPQTFLLRFPNLAQGTNAVLRVSGRYLGGTFGASLRVKVP